jgi:hypothetical protein
MEPVSFKARAIAHRVSPHRASRQIRRVSRIGTSAVILSVVVTVLAIGTWFAADRYFQDAVVATILCGIAFVSLAPRIAAGVFQGHRGDGGR